MILKWVVNHLSLVEFIDVDGDLEEKLKEFEGSFERVEVVDLWSYWKKILKRKMLEINVCSLNITCVVN